MKLIEKTRGKEAVVVVVGTGLTAIRRCAKLHMKKRRSRNNYFSLKTKNRILLSQEYV